MNNCTTGSCPATQSADYRVIKPMPKPTEADMDDPLFDAIWEAIACRRLQCPEYYEGWQIATGEQENM